MLLLCCCVGAFALSLLLCVIWALLFSGVLLFCFMFEYGVGLV